MTQQTARSPPRSWHENSMRLKAASGHEAAVAIVKRARAEQRDAEEMLADMAIAAPKAEQAARGVEEGR